MKDTFFIIAMISLFSIPDSKASFQFLPTNFELSTKGAKSVKIVQIKNPQSEPIAVKIRITKRLQNLDGTESRPETDEMTVFPYQLMLEPHSSRTIKVSWKGPETLETEKAYRILVEQVPVQFSPTSIAKKSINIMTNYAGTIYVMSKGTFFPEVQAVSLVKADNDFILHLKNSGTKRLLLRNIKLSVSCLNSLAKDEYTELPGSSYNEIEGHHILARTEIKYRIQIPNFLRTCELEKWKFHYD